MQRVSLVEGRQIRSSSRRVAKHCGRKVSTVDKVKGHQLNPKSRSDVQRRLIYSKHNLNDVCWI